MRKEVEAKPRLIGSCHSEGLLIVATGPAASISRIEETIALMIPEKDYPFTFKQLRTSILNKIIDVTKENDADTIKRALGEVYSDMFTNIGVQRSVLECLESSEAPVFLYSFDFFNPKSWGLMGHRLPYKGALANFEFTADDLRVLEITTKLWTNFAKYGDPNGSAFDTSSSLSDLCPPFRWEPATKENPQRHLSIALEPSMHETFKNGRPLLFAKMRMENVSIKSSATDSVSDSFSTAPYNCYDVGDVVKSCDSTGRWMGKSPGVYENPWGWTNFTVCFKMDFENVKYRLCVTRADYATRPKEKAEWPP
uniref:COesterase domain-containing protein n=1 Tax=Heterorhabditis bacteriophora TaxID=37862 RepID=A0A1I7XSV2_HETBA